MTSVTLHQASWLAPAPTLLVPFISRYLLYTLLIVSTKVLIKLEGGRCITRDTEVVGGGYKVWQDAKQGGRWLLLFLLSPKEFGKQVSN